MSTSFVLNGKSVTLDADPTTPLSGRFARTRACTARSSAAAWRSAAPALVHLEGEATRSCVLPLAAVADKRITTIEGIESRPAKAIQAAWVKLQVPQCGYCQSGQIMSATSLARTQRHAHRRRHRHRDERQSVPLRDLHPHPRGHPRSRCDPEGLTMTTDLDLTDAVRPSRRTFLKAAGAMSRQSVSPSASNGRAWAAARSPPRCPTPPSRPMPSCASRRTTASRSSPSTSRWASGAYTGIATIVAEELDANWQDVRVESAPADAKRYANLAFGTIQGTGGSSAMANLVDAIARSRRESARDAGLRRRRAVADVPASELTTRDGSVHHAATNRTATYGSLASAAARLPVPDKVALKSPKDFRLIGHQLPRVDVPPKTNGTAQFTLDVTFPGMLVALLQRPPLFGATVRSFDASAAKAVPGVVSVVQVPGGVAVVAKGFWAAKQGRDALKIEWDDSKAEKRSSDAIMAEYRQLAEQLGAFRPQGRRCDAGARGRSEEDLRHLLVPVSRSRADGAARRRRQAHRRQLRDLGRRPVPDGRPGQCRAHSRARSAAGEDSHAVCGRQLSGGARTRGRTISSRPCPIAEALGANGTPVKLQWTREDDIHGGLYRPMYFHKLDAGLTADGKLVGWRQRIVGQSILGGTPFASVMVKNGIDGTSVEGAANVAYAIPNISVELTTTQTGVPVLWWRVVGSSHTAFAVEAIHRRSRARRGQGPVRLPPRSARARTAHAGRARTRRAESGLGPGQAVAEGPRARHRRGRGVQDVRRAGLRKSPSTRTGT